MSFIRTCAALLVPLSFIALKGADAGLPSVDEIAHRNTEARGGLDKIRAIQSLKLVGTANINGAMDAQVTVQAKRPNLFRLDLILPQGQLIQAFDGTDVWSINPFIGQTEPRKVTDADATALRDDADMDGPLVDYKAKGNAVEMVGADAVDGSPAWKLKLTTKNGTVSTIWIDQKTWQQSRMMQTRHQNGEEVQLIIRFSNFKPINGVIMPLTHDQQAGPFAMKINFSSARANEDIDDSVFRMPGGPPAGAAPASGQSTPPGK